MLNADYKEMLQSLVDASVEFMLAGAYALAAHGYPRSTMDIVFGSSLSAPQLVPHQPLQSIEFDLVDRVQHAT